VEVECPAPLAARDDDDGGGGRDGGDDDNGGGGSGGIELDVEDGEAEAQGGREHTSDTDATTAACFSLPELIMSIATISSG
jgi:hypothetical protein